MKWKYVDNLKDLKYIEQVENEYGVTFPNYFKGIVEKYNHGTPFPNSFDTEHLRGKAFGELLNFNLNAEYNILKTYSGIKEKFPPQVFPFTVTPGGDHLCFDYSKKAQSPTIAYWNHEQIYEIEEDTLVIRDHKNEYEYYKIEFVADKLSDLFEKLYDDDDDEPKKTIWEDFFDEERMRRSLSDESLAQVNTRRALKNLPPILRNS